MPDLGIRFQKYDNKISSKKTETKMKYDTIQIKLYVKPDFSSLIV